MLSIGTFNSFLFESVYCKGVSRCFVLVAFKYLSLVNSSRSSLSFDSRYLRFTPFALIELLLTFWVPKALGNPQKCCEIMFIYYNSKRDHRHNTSAICFVLFKLSFMHVCSLFLITVRYYTILWQFSANRGVPVIFRSFSDEHKHHRFRKTPS